MKRGHWGTSTHLLIPSAGDSSGPSVSDGLLSTVELGDNGKEAVHGLSSWKVVFQRV